MRLSFLALFNNGAGRESQIEPVVEICRRYGVGVPDRDANHFSADLGNVRLTWERHTEFTRYLIIAAGLSDHPFTPAAITELSPDWITRLPGQLVAAAHIAYMRGTADVSNEVAALSRRHFDGNPLVGAYLAERAGLALTDFRIHGDGFGRFLLFGDRLAPRQAGRMVQRLVEIEAYRLVALLALPVARELAPTISVAEAELADISAALSAEQAVDEPRLLDRLTRLEAQIQQRHFATSNRFGASEAYYRLIQRRIDELREQRIEGLQTFREFIGRRLAPAIDTCLSTSRRQDKLAQRVTQATQLLATRVEIARQGQNQAVLASMDRRVALQVRLQQTVEGLSVAAITYYVVGLIGYVVKGLPAGALGGASDAMIVAASVPVVAALAAFGVRHIRKQVTPQTKSGASAEHGEERLQV
jgi:uncharacterized membrane-anchored protein